MKVVILAGGAGTRLSEETEVRPKPMVEIGHRPAVDGDVTYGDTSMTTEWIDANFPRWRISGIDRSLDDPYQLCMENSATGSSII